MDLFSRLEPTCGECAQMGDPIDSGIRYCWGEKSWRWPHERVLGCPYRGGPSRRVEHPRATAEAEAICDLLESPRHTISPKDRAWLRSEQRALSSNPPPLGSSEAEDGLPGISSKTEEA